MYTNVPRQTWIWRHLYVPLPSPNQATLSTENPGFSLSDFRKFYPFRLLLTNWPMEADNGLRKEVIPSRSWWVSYKFSVFLSRMCLQTRVIRKFGRVPVLVGGCIYWLPAPLSRLIQSLLLCLVVVGNFFTWLRLYNCTSALLCYRGSVRHNRARLQVIANIYPIDWYHLI